MKEIVFGFITAFVVVLLTTPSLIKVAKMKHLVDEPSESRKLHRQSIPTIGGIIIFAATIFSFALWFPATDARYFGNALSFNQAVSDFKYLIAASILIFFIGVKDDIIGFAPVKKLIGHIIVGFIFVLMADIRITGLHGVFGVEQIPYWASVFLSIFTYVVVVNSFNLIDGIDGLAAGIGLVASTLFGAWFFFSGNLHLSLMCLVLSGALSGFLIFNFSPARIFMGDSGSLFIGAFIFVMAIKCVETNTDLLPAGLNNISAPVFTMAVLCYPLIDTLRIFTLRVMQGNSPFAADKNHIHHRLLRHGLNHVKTAGLLYFVSFVVPLISLLFVNVNPTLAFLAMMAIGIVALQLVLFITKSKKEKSLAH